MTTIDFEEKIVDALRYGRVSYKDLLQLTGYIDMGTLQNIFEKYISTIDLSSK